MSCRPIYTLFYFRLPFSPIAFLEMTKKHRLDHAVSKQVSRQLDAMRDDVIAIIWLNLVTQLCADLKRSQVLLTWPLCTAVIVSVTFCLFKSYLNKKVLFACCALIFLMDSLRITGTFSKVENALLQMWREEVGCFEMFLAYFGQYRKSFDGKCHRDILVDILSCHEDVLM